MKIYENFGIRVNIVLNNRIIRQVKDISNNYYKLFLIIGPSNSGKTNCLKELANKFGSDIINLNYELSKKLKSLPIDKRWNYVQDYTYEILTHSKDQHIFIDNTEILFSNHLKVEPLYLFTNMSKYFNLIATWNGKIQNGYLIYGDSSHIDYKKYKIEDLECDYFYLEE